ncbi:hypothetical protein [Jiella pacifica]|mgnify:CR=1 FL=1|uniref:Uncharacterized protein n=1 Tax=Jiella pacifica TaxID=2696469 RepID=A0A6N9T689_9HYPH|nr:hypothetical protein [Jiella pacifica]MAU95509.1 hypothetical protein [Fulvimarina sp.]NDW06821.1 hypothetical protein [Jiella pacifica]
MILTYKNTAREDEFIQLVKYGYRVEVICAKSARKQHANWYGRWFVRAVNEKSGKETVLVTARKSDDGARKMQPRFFRTLPGLFSFLYENDLSSIIAVPAQSGMRSVQPDTD